MVSADVMPMGWEFMDIEDETLAFLYERNLSYKDICFHIRARETYQFSRFEEFYVKYPWIKQSKEQLKEYRVETMKQAEDQTNLILDKLLREGAIKENRGCYSVTEMGKSYIEFWNEHKDDWCRLMDESGEDNDRDDEDSYIDDRYDGHWEENEKDHKFMERLFDIES